MITTLLAIASSMVAEIITALNKKLNGTVLKGYAAFLVALAVAFVGGMVKEVITPGFTFASLLNIGTLASDFMQVFGITQVYFYLVMQYLELDVNSAPAATVTTTTTTVAAPAPQASAASAV